MPDRKTQEHKGPESKDTLGSFKDFIKENGVIAYAAGMIIALSLKDFITSIVSDIIVPGINMILLSLKIKNISKYLPGKEKIDIFQFLKTFISFVFIMITTFFVLNYTIKNIINK
jgi:large-conductance mechanosensitive channel